MEANGANVKLGNELIGASLVYFILFNRKRSGEVMWILRKNFEDILFSNFKIKIKINHTSL